MLLKHWECAPMEIFFRRSSSFNSCSCSLSWIYLHKIFFQSISNDCFCFLSSKRLLWENAQKHENGRMYRFDYSFVARIEKLKSRKYLDSTYIMLVLLQYIYQLSTHRHKIWILSCAFMQTMSQRSKVHGDGALFDSDVYQKLKWRSPPSNFI